MHRGQVLRDQGKLSEALKEFQTGGDDRSVERNCAAGDQAHAEADRQGATAGEPSSDLARAPAGAERVGRKHRGAGTTGPDFTDAVDAKAGRGFEEVYEAIGNLAGINVLFDPDYTPRRIHIELNAVSLEQALRVAALESHTFWRPVTPNTIYIAQDTQQKRTRGGAAGAAHVLPE